MSENSEFIKHYPYPQRWRSWAYEKWLGLGLTKALKTRRTNFIDTLLEGAISSADRILEVGCGSGRDFVKSMEGRSCQIYGLDPFDAGIRQDNFQFIQGDMASIPFPDKFFDVTLSFGVMEHIEPFEKLSAGIREMVRVGKKYCMVVPCISTRFEPHCWQYKWQLRKGINEPRDVNYMSDAAWTKFEGFKGARVARFDYIPLMVTNLMIYGSNP